MRRVAVDLDDVIIDEGVIESDNASLEKLARQLVENEDGSFNNDEIYPDRDLAIAEFLADLLGGTVVEEDMNA